MRGVGAPKLCSPAAPAYRAVAAETAETAGVGVFSKIKLIQEYIYIYKTPSLENFKHTKQTCYPQMYHSDAVALAVRPGIQGYAQLHRHNREYKLAELRVCVS